MKYKNNLQLYKMPAPPPNETNFARTDTQTQPTSYYAIIQTSAKQADYLLQ